ncbi:hypothetical protein MYA_2350 [Burkholderia sp. KJ006]|nr:hypothetical protein MYA_2350 [Burkholderia sp. KJ006]
MYCTAARLAATIRDAHRPTMRTHGATTTAERALVHHMLR